MRTTPLRALSKSRCQRWSPAPFERRNFAFDGRVLAALIIPRRHSLPFPKQSLLPTRCDPSQAELMLGGPSGGSEAGRSVVRDWGSGNGSGATGVASRCGAGVMRTARQAKRVGMGGGMGGRVARAR